MKIRGRFWAATYALLSVSFNTYADDAIKAGQAGVAATGVAAEAGSDISTAQATTILGLPVDRFYLNYFAIFHGPALNDVSSPYQLDRNGNASRTPLWFDSEVTTAYMITKDIGIGPDIPFLLAPVLGQGIIMNDLGIKTFNRHFIHSGGFNVYANLYVQAPTSAASQANGMEWALKSTPAIRYDVPKSRFALGAWTEIKDYFGVTRDKTFKLYAEPYVSYQIMPKLAANVGYEMEAHHNVGDQAYFNFTSYETDLQPGVIWNITPKVLVNPYVQLFTGNRVDTDHAALGAVISATVL